jgi:hypothetical protein
LINAAEKFFINEWIIFINLNKKNSRVCIY